MSKTRPLASAAGTASRSSRAPVPDYTSDLSGDVRGLRIGVVKEYFEAALDPQVETATRRAMDTLEGLGAKISEISFPMYEESQYCEK